MTRNTRLFIAILLALLSASALGRADLGADTEASVLWSPAFQTGVLPALAVGWLLAPRFGRAGAAGWIIAALAMLAVVAGAGIVAALALGQGPLALLTLAARQPLGLGALVFGAGAAQILALRGQSRK